MPTRKTKSRISKRAKNDKFGNTSQQSGNGLRETTTKGGALIMKRKDKSFGETIAGRLKAFAEATENDTVHEKYTARTVKLNLELEPYDADLVKKTRQMFGTSQAIFAPVSRSVGRDCCGLGARCPTANGKSLSTNGRNEKQPRVLETATS